MRNTGIGEYYEARFSDNPCGHAHHTFEAAERCASHTIRLTRKPTGIDADMPAYARVHHVTYGK